MPTYNAADVLNKSLIATQRVPVYSNYTEPLNIIGYVEPGNTCGVVYSYVGGYNGLPLYWMFLTPNKSAYYIKHDPNAFNTSNIQQQMQVAWVKDLETKASDAKEAQEKEEKGAIIYYIEKYGSILLFTTVGIVAFKEFMKYSNAKK